MTPDHNTLQAYDDLHDPRVGSSWKDRRKVAVRVIALFLNLAAVDDVDNVGNGNGSLGNVGSKNDTSLSLLSTKTW